MTPNDVRTIVDNLDDFIELPDGVEHLRKAVLTLAVSGKLVPQNPKEGTAEELYARVAKKDKKFAVTENPAFEVPSSWKWVVLPDIYDINPRNDIADSLDVSFLPMTRISSVWSEAPQVIEERKWKEVKKGYTHIKENDVVLAKITPCFENGKMGIARGLKNGFAAGTTELYIFRDQSGLLSPEYLLCFFRSGYFTSEGQKNMTGTAGQKRLSRKFLEKFPFPLPPLKEQIRIAQKVNELLNKLDAFETHKHERDVARSRLTRSAMAALGRSESRLALEHLDELVKQPEDITELNNAILSLAVSGKLSTHRAVSNNEGGPFAIPSDWKWVRLGDLTELNNGHAFKPSDWVSQGVPIVRIQNLNNPNSSYNYSNNADANKKHAISSGDVLLSWSGTPGTSFGIFIWERGKAVLNQHIFRCVFKEEVDKEYFKMAGNFSIAGALNTAHGGAGLKHLRKGQVENLFIPLPPVPEQKRISKRMREVLKLTDDIGSTLGI